MDPPLNPAGELVLEEGYGAVRLQELIDELVAAPQTLRATVAGLTDQQLDTKYRNWTIRQIVHHLADSHLNSYIRCKWTLTEDTPTIKAYFEDRWVALADSQHGDVGPALSLFDAVHARWVQLLHTLTPTDMAKSFLHPESGKTIRLDELISYYPWHSRHHTAQIAWVREQHGW